MPQRADFEEYLSDGPNVAFLCEIHVHDTSIADWQRVFDRLLADRRWRVTYIDNDRVTRLPLTVDAVFARDREWSGRIELRVPGLVDSLDAILDGPGHIEFFTSALAVDDQPKFGTLLGFAAEIADLLGKPAAISGEAAGDAPFLVYDPTAAMWVAS